MANQNVEFNYNYEGKDYSCLVGYWPSMGPNGLMDWNFAFAEVKDEEGGECYEETAAITFREKITVFDLIIEKPRKLIKPENLRGERI